MAEEQKVIIRQNPGDELAVEHQGGLAVFGVRSQPAIQHIVDACVVHETQKPLVHIHSWDVERGPVAVEMTHHFQGEHNQTLHIQPFGHDMRVETRESNPIHHALQMRTPIAVRVGMDCTCVMESDYTFEVRTAERQLFTMTVKGRTVFKDECPDFRPVVRVLNQ